MAQFASNNAAGAPAPVASGANSTAGGYGASATGAGSTVVGNGSTDNGNAGAVAVGQNASVLGVGSIAIGQGTSARTSAIQQGVIDYRNPGNNSAIVNSGAANQTPSGIAIGRNSTVNTGGGVALGDNNIAGSTNGFASTAIGTSNLASGGYSTALGVNNTASGSSSIAFGVNNTASGIRAIAIGRQSLATGDFSIAQGFVASGYGANSVAVGANSVAGVAGGTQANDVAIGSGATSTAGDGVALGAGSNANRLGLRGAAESFSGTNVGSTNSAVSVGNVGGERQIINVAGGTQDTDAVNVRQLRSVGSNLAGSLGGGSAFDPATGAYTGPTYTVNGTNYNNAGSAIAALDANTTGAGAFRSENTAGAADPVATGANSTAGGYGAAATGAGSTVIGNGATDNGNANAVAVGNGANVAAGLTGSNVALGQGSTVASNAVGTTGATIGGTNYTFAGGAPAGTVSVGSAGAERTITNVAAGRLSGTSTDAVNGSQLFATNTQVTNNANAITGLANGTSGPLQRGAANQLVAVANGGTAAAPGAAQTLTNIAAGSLAAGSTDAVNGGQLNTTNTNVTTIGTRTTTLGNNVATGLGGGATYSAGGGLTAPTYNVYGTNQNNVGSAVTALQTGAPVQFSNAAGVAAPQTPSNDVTLVGAAAGPVGLHNVRAGTLAAGSTDAVNGGQLFTTNQQVTNLTNGTAGLVQQNAGTRAITVGAGTDGTTVGFANNAGTARTLTGVAAGQVAVASTQAINGSQLYGTANSVASGLGGGSIVNPDGTVSAPTYNLASGTYTNVGSALTALDNSIAGGQTGAFRSDNTAGAAAPVATGANSTAGGFGASATGAGSTALGNGATDNGNANATVVGSGAAVTAGLAGSNAAFGNNSVALRGAETNYAGYGVGTQTSAGELAVGTPTAARTITGVAAGRLATDAANVGQLQAVGGNLATSFGGGAGLDPVTGAYTAPTYTVAGATYNNVGGALGALDSGLASGQIGAFRSDNTASAAAPAATGANSTAGGFGASATGANSTVVGNGATDNGTANATVLGRNGSVTQAGGVALGFGSTATRAGLAGAQEAFSGNGVASTQGAVSVGAVGAERQIINVAGGTQDTDAVNVRQLRSVGSGLATSLGGGAGFDPVTGAYTPPTYTVAGTTYNTVGGALGAFDSGIASGQIGAFRSENTAGAAAPVATGANSTAGGFGASATGAGSTALGNGATDNGNANSTVLGNGATVAAGLAGSNVALGQGSAALRGAETNYAGYGVGTQTSAGELAVGTPTAARTVTGVAAGRLATDAANVGQLQAVGNNLATSFGGGAGFDPVTGAYTAPTYTVAGATYNNVGGALGALDSGLASGQIGAFRSDNTAGAAAPVATGANSTAGGFGASATGVASTVIGNGATDNGNANATALGNGAAVTAGLAGSNVALGHNSVATRGAETNYAGYGVGTQTSAGELAVGTPTAARTITGVAAGRLATDAANVGQLQAVGNNLATSLGGGAGFDPLTGAFTAPTYTVAGTTYNNVGGAIGALDSGLASGQVGAFRSDNTAGAAAPTATGANSVAGGFGASATGAGSTAIGNGARDNGNANATVVGNGATVAANLTGSNVALGQGSAATRGAQTNYNAFGTDTPQTSVGEVAVGSAAAPRQITGVAAGSADTDAVNVAQLRGAASDLGTSTATALGGGSTYDPTTGRVTGPSYSLNNGTVTATNVGDALTNLDGRTTSNATAIAGLQNGTSGIVQQGSAGAPITVGAGTDGTVVNFTNNAGAARTLDGVAAGQVTAASQQAVNGGQLYASANSTASALGGGSTVNADGTVSAPTYRVNGTAYNNVGGAITALDSTGVKYDTAPGGGRGQSITLAGGDPNQPVVIRNVAAGTARTDAANTGQVQDAEARAKAYTNNRIASIEGDMSGLNNRLNGLSQDVEQAKKDARTAAAIGLAASSLRYDDRPGKFSIAAGGGYWKGYSAGAFGAGYTLPDGHIRLNATAATDGRDVGAGGGVSYTFN